MQTQKRSLFEVCCNVATGFVLAYFTWKVIFIPHVNLFGWDIAHLTWWQIFYANAWFTIVSVIRSYLWRRFFNRMDNNGHQKE